MSQQWEPIRFKANLQAMLMVNSVMVIIAHLIGGHYTGAVLQDYLIALPVIVIGALAGFSLDQRINPVVFRRTVFVVLFFIGVKMLLS